VADLILVRRLDAPPEMKVSTESLDDGTHAPDQTQSIICGGGWKNPPKQYRLKIKAICGAFLTVVAAAASISYYPAFGAFGLIPTSGLLISTVVLFRFERPATFLGPQDGDHDIRNLYGWSGTRREKPSREQADDDKVA
jgi:hypothetical protein